MLQHIVEFPSLFRLNNTLSFVYSTFCLSIHLSVSKELLPRFSYCDEFRYEHGNTNISLRPHFSFFVGCLSAKDQPEV